MNEKNKEIIEIRDPEIDVQAIMAEIREKIAQRREQGIYTSEIENGQSIPFPDPDLFSQGKGFHSTLVQKARLDLDLPIASHRRPPMSTLILVGKRFLRKILRWYFEQIGLQVESFQRAVVDELREQRSEIQQFIHEAGTLSKRIDVLQKNSEVLQKSLEVQGKSLEANVLWVKSVEEKIPKVMETKDPQGVVFLDTLKFNQRYGGQPEALRKRYERFASYFKGCRNVLDLGCGQGAFLKLMKNQGIPALGIDRDERMVQQCRNQGFDAVQGDVLSYLEGQKGNCIEGIFAAHLIEHLATSELLSFVKSCHKALRDGSPLVLISPNGCSVFVLTQAFYRDPTHVKPVHPDTLSFLLESQGFRELQVIPYEPVPPELQLSRIVDEKDPAQSALNRHIDEINRLLFGFQDYAVVAKK